MLGMGWLWLVASIKLQVSFVKEPYKRDAILHKRPMILSIPTNRSHPILCHLLQVHTHSYKYYKLHLHYTSSISVWLARKYESLIEPAAGNPGSYYTWIRHTTRMDKCAPNMFERVLSHVPTSHAQRLVSLSCRSPCSRSISMRDMTHYGRFDIWYFLSIVFICVARHMHRVAWLIHKWLCGTTHWYVVMLWR